MTANTGLATIATANPLLTGAGATTVLTAGTGGTIVRSVTIKSIPVADLFVFSQEGMVRLYVQNDTSSITSLYKEIPIPPMPKMQSLPLPFPRLLTFETILLGDLKLQPGYKLLASTQVANTFNIIAEGVDWAYPGSTPNLCCNFLQEIPITGLGTVSVSNGNYTGTTNTVDIFDATGGANGSVIKSITIKALQSTHEGIVRFFVNDGTDNYLMREVHIPQTDQSAFTPSFKQVIEMDFYLKAGYSIFASTVLPESFAITIEGVDWVYA